MAPQEPFTLRTFPLRFSDVRWRDRRSESFLGSTIRPARRWSASLRRKLWTGSSNESGRSQASVFHWSAGDAAKLPGTSLRFATLGN